MSFRVSYTPAPPPPHFPGRCGTSADAIKANPSLQHWSWCSLSVLQTGYGDFHHSCQISQVLITFILEPFWFNHTEHVAAPPTAGMWQGLCAGSTRGPQFSPRGLPQAPSTLCLASPAQGTFSDVILRTCVDTGCLQCFLHTSHSTKLEHFPHLYSICVGRLSPPHTIRYELLVVRDLVEFCGLNRQQNMWHTSLSEGWIDK